MKKYEALVMFPVLPGAELQQADTSVFETALAKQGGKVVHKTDLGRRPLGYAIKKAKEAHVVCFDFELSPDKVNALNLALLLEENILKFTIIVKPVINLSRPKRRVRRVRPKPTVATKEVPRTGVHHGS